MSAFTLSSGRAQKAAGLRLNPAWRVFLAATYGLFVEVSVLAQTPAVGAKAPNFTLSTPTGKAVTMSTEEGGPSRLARRAPPAGKTRFRQIGRTELCASS